MPYILFLLLFILFYSFSFYFSYLSYVDTFYSLPHVNNRETFYAYLYMNKYLS